MSFLQLAWNDITNNSLRSWVVAICATVLAAFSLFSLLLLHGITVSLDLATQRLGADMVVVPEGAQTKIEGALLMGVPTQLWMPAEYVQEISMIPGIEAVSPQVYLATLTGSSCCSVPDMFMVAYDPQTDFTVSPWLKKQLPGGLQLGEVIGGDNIYATEGEDGILVYGDRVTLKGKLAPTGSALDQSLFFTMDTAIDIAHISTLKAKQPLVIPPNQVSAILIKTKPGIDNEQVAILISRSIPGVVPIESKGLFQSSQVQLANMQDLLVILMAVVWPMVILLVGLIYLMAANERRRELGVLRALGATRSYVLKTLLAEAGLLAFYGASVGIFLAILAIYPFRRLIMSSLGVPFLLPSIGSLVLQIGIGLILAMLSIFFAVLFPALKVSRQDPAAAMRE